MIDGLEINFSDVNGWSVLLTLLFVIALAIFLRFATEAQSQRIVGRVMTGAVATVAVNTGRLNLVESRMNQFERDYRETRERVRVLETKISVFSPHG